MDKTHAFDPNRTAAIGQSMATQAMPPIIDPNKTGVMAAPGPIVTEIQVAVTPGRVATMANGPAREQFLIEIMSPTEPGLPGVSTGTTRTPLNLCLAIDRSGSMEGPALEYAKQACGYVVDMLGPNDILSIVTFEDIVEVLMTPQRVTAKQPIKDGIARIQAGNTTNLFDSLSLSMQQIASVGDPGRATRIVVLTDGEPTAGIKDFASLVNHAGEIKQRGITCTFLGFGTEYNEELLAAMAKKAGGNYYYIPRPELIPEIFRLEIDKMLTTSAQNISLEVNLARWTKLRAATGQSVPPGEKSFTIHLADLEQGAVLQQMIDLEFPNHPLGHYRVAAGKLSYDDTRSGTRKTIDIDLVMEFTDVAARYSEPVNPKVASAADLAAASRAVERTIMGLKTGQMTGAVAIAELQKTQAFLLQDGRVAEAQEVTMALRAIQSGDQSGAEKTLMGTMVQMDQGKKTT